MIRVTLTAGELKQTLTAENYDISCTDSEFEDVLTFEIVHKENEYLKFTVKREYMVITLDEAYHPYHKALNIDDFDILCESDKYLMIQGQTKDDYIEQGPCKPYCTRFDVVRESDDPRVIDIILNSSLFEDCFEKEARKLIGEKSQNLVTTVQMLEKQFDDIKNWAFVQSVYPVSLSLEKNKFDTAFAFCADEFFIAKNGSKSIQNGSIFFNVDFIAKPKNALKTPELSNYVKYIILRKEVSINLKTKKCIFWSDDFKPVGRLHICIHMSNDYTYVTNFAREKKELTSLFEEEAEKLFENNSNVIKLITKEMTENDLLTVSEFIFMSKKKMFIDSKISNSSD